MSLAQTATLAHGYSMDELDKAARVAIKHVPGAGMLDVSDRWDYAWQAVVEHLYASTSRPEFFDLCNAGRRALRDAVYEVYREHGIVRGAKAESSPSADGLRAGFGKVWVTDMRTSSNDFTEATVERLTLPQVLGLLSDTEYQVIAALAAHGRQSAAVAALGINPKTFDSRLRRARERILRAWLEGETPWALRKVDPDRECRAGHGRAAHGYRQASGAWKCRVCDRNAARRQRARGARGSRKAD